MTKKPKVLLLAAGLGTRLRPHTDYLPKCLMPIKGIPLLEIWIRNLQNLGLDDILINLHYRSEDVLEFLNREIWTANIQTVFEEKLLGTAGTVRANYNFLADDTLLLVHADNLCICDFDAFLNFHYSDRPPETSMTMMSFQTDFPESCGILELDSKGIVQKFHEKVKNPPGNLANAAIYLLEPEVTDWIFKEKIDDFSNELIPNFLGKIATWENKNVMRDIGNPDQLKLAQSVDIQLEPIQDKWFQSFSEHKVHSF